MHCIYDIHEGKKNKNKSFHARETPVPLCEPVHLAPMAREF